MKRGVNAAMEKPVRGAIATVTVGAGDEPGVLTQPIEVAKECSANKPPRYLPT